MLRGHLKAGSLGFARRGKKLVAKHERTERLRKIHIDPVDICHQVGPPVFSMIRSLLDKSAGPTAVALRQINFGKISIA
jgi:hypothetical protein